MFDHEVGFLGPCSCDGTVCYMFADRAPPSAWCQQGGEIVAKTPPLGPEVDLLIGPRHAVLGGGDVCEHRHWGLRWASLWGHEA
eukprot:1308805-Pyramimonas_sp.AAC.1